MLKDEIAANKEKMKEQGKWARFKYFWYYHWVHAVLILIALFCIVTYIRHFIEASKEPYIYVAMANSALLTEEETDLVTDFAISRGADLKVNPAQLDVTYQMSQTHNSSLDVSYSQKMSAYLEKGKIDILIAPEWILDSCANQAYLADLKSLLPEDLYNSCKSRLIYFTYEEDGDVPIGIYVGDLPKIKDFYGEEEKPYLAVGYLALHQDTAFEFLRYLLED